MQLISFAETNRSYGATDMNQNSSRSHVLVRLTFKRGFVVGGVGVGVGVGFLS